MLKQIMDLIVSLETCSELVKCGKYWVSPPSGLQFAARELRPFFALGTKGLFSGNDGLAIRAVILKDWI